jgi:HK97 family phage major capsid protein
MSCASCAEGSQMLTNEVKELLEKLQAEWSNFKAENDRRLKEIEKTGSADPLTDEKIKKHSEAVGQLQKQVDELTAKLSRPGMEFPTTESELVKEHKTAFRRWISKGKDEGLADLQTKTMRVSVDADGGYAVPEALDRTIGDMERAAAPMEAEVTIIQAGSETYEKLFRDGMAGSGWVGEEDARPATASPTLASFKPLYGEVYAMPEATQKLLDDAFFDVEAWIADEIAQKFSADIDLAIISGNGTNKPKGILSYTLATTADASRAYGTIQRVQSGVNADFDGDDILSLIYALRPQYRQGAKFLMETSIITKIRQIKDTNGNYIWAPGFNEAQPAGVFNYGIIEDPNMPVAGAASNSIIFGNFKRAYKLVVIKGIRVLRDPYTNKPYVRFYTTKRVGGGVEDTRALKFLQLAP